MILCCFDVRGFAASGFLSGRGFDATGFSPFSFAGFAGSEKNFTSSAAGMRTRPNERWISRMNGPREVGSSGASRDSRSALHLEDGMGRPCSIGVTTPSSSARHKPQTPVTTQRANRR